MLTTVMATAALAGGLPGVEVSWRGDASRLHVVAPEGEHVALDAPLRATLTSGDEAWTFDGLAGSVSGGVPFGDARGRAVSGAMSVSLCLDGGTQCRFVDVGFDGAVPEAKKGRVPLTSREPGAARGHEGPFKADAAEAAQAAFAEAARRGVPVLIDFAAVWCPPCDLLEAQVLYAPDHADLIAEYVLLSVDVDDPSSWALKDRYAVTGYPTTVVALADGAEIGRMVGYPGAEPTVQWLGDLADGQAAEATTPVAKARRAWSLFQRGLDEEAAEALKEAEGAEDTVPYRLVRVVTAPNLDDARWLTEHAPETGADWIFYATDLADDDAGKVALTVAIEQALPHTAPAPAADLLYTMGRIVGEPLARGWYAAAATMLKASFSGDDETDRGQWTWYAQLLDHAGDTDAGLAFLEDARRRYPDEPTWALTGARVLLERDRPAEALTWVDRDLGTAWGDNQLRMAALRIEALQALDRSTEAKAYAAEVLAAQPPPPEGSSVRSSRYRAKIEDLVRDPAPEIAAP